MPKTGTIRNWESASLVIPNGSSNSGSLIHAGRPILGIVMPTGWTAASLSFDVAACPGGTLFPLYSDSGTQLSIIGAASRAISSCTVLDKLGAFWAFRIRSGSIVGEEVDQGAARTFAIFFEG